MKSYHWYNVCTYIYILRHNNLFISKIQITIYLSCSFGLIIIYLYTIETDITSSFHSRWINYSLTALLWLIPAMNLHWLIEILWNYCRYTTVTSSYPIIILWSFIVIIIIKIVIFPLSIIITKAPLWSTNNVIQYYLIRIEIWNLCVFVGKLKKNILKIKHSLSWTTIVLFIDFCNFRF